MNDYIHLPAHQLARLNLSQFERRLALEPPPPKRGRKPKSASSSGTPKNNNNVEDDDDNEGRVHTTYTLSCFRDANRIV